MTSRARSRSRAPSTRAPLSSAPVVVDVSRGNAKAPLIIDVPARPKSRARSRSVGGPLIDAPGLSGGRGMFKRLIVACDGTWNNSDDGMNNGTLAIPSNITRISRAIKTISQDGIPQIVNYHQGLGTEGGRLSRIIGGATGKGLSEDVREAYSFLANNYHPGDEIFLLGFSRGAFTARSIGGLIGEIGLLTKKGLNTLPEVYDDIQHRRNPDHRSKHDEPRRPSADSPRYAEDLQRRGLTRLDIPIKAIGVWDTVGSLGIPRIGILQRAGLQMKQSRATSFHDTKLSNCIENAFQALALDENRSAFSPAVWEKPEGNRTTLRQVWFPGAHANVGGGYDDMQLANITLAWMMSQLEPFLDMRDDYLFEQDELNEKHYMKEEGSVRPWSFGKIYSEVKGAFALSGSTIRKPGQYTAVEPHNGKATDRPLRQTNEYIHPSVRSRYRLEGPGTQDRGLYEARGLTDYYKLVVDYGLNNQRSGDPEVYWKIKWRDTDAVKVLPEAPLWRLERELARRDGETYDYIKRPPASGSSKKRKSSRPMSAISAKSAKSTKSTKSVSRAPSGIVSPSTAGGHNRRRETFSPRQTFLAEKPPKRSSTFQHETKKEPARARSRSRARSVEFDRETDIRESMPHKREKDKAWWEGRRQQG